MRCFSLTALSPQRSFEVIAFGVLNIGLEPIESIPVGQRISDAWLQSIAVRASGFAIVPTGAVAPALQLAWIVLMYIAVYRQQIVFLVAKGGLLLTQYLSAIALSVRATNTYEEKALGIYVQDDSTKSEVEPELNGTRSEMLGQYLRWHARRQLAFVRPSPAPSAFLPSLIFPFSLPKGHLAFDARHLADRHHRGEARRELWWRKAGS